LLDEINFRCEKNRKDKNYKLIQLIVINMKVILSRKGFDSTYGGYPSPILPDGRLISLPIPSNDIVKYSDLKFEDNKSYFDLMKELKSKIRYDEKRYKLTKETECHLDPDICKNILQREEKWKHCFGQIDQAQSHLTNKNIKNGDLFLFFGWFKKTEFKNGILQFDKSAPDLHIIFGYFQIGEVIRINDNTIVPKWMKHHPHAINKSRKKNPTNTIYVANDKLTWNKKIAGAGVFKYNKELVLTKKVVLVQNGIYQFFLKVQK